MNFCYRRNETAHVHLGPVRTVAILLKPAAVVAPYFKLGPIGVCVVSK